MLIEMEAVAANAVDVMFRRGDGPWSLGLPGTLSGDVVGHVAAIGPGVTTVTVGDRVAASSADAFADFVLADARWLVPIPGDADPAGATCLAASAPTALRLLRAGQVRAEETVLVHAAAGGIGHLTLQLAKELGARTIGAASTPQKTAFAAAMGADVVVDSSREDWADRVRDAAPGGVDVVLDAVGATTFDSGLALLAPLGRIVTYGAIGGAVPVLRAEALYANVYVTGVSLMGWRSASPADARAELDEVVELWRAGRLRQVVHSRLPLDEGGKAHEILENRANMGRVVITR
ncbi:zinc-binding alcohol dehydrogenase family protein [Micromonospora sp. NPDC000089]|uniref:quinone oxidoreductase family protein n=1 Tax=unclassified Micromonospora TaxID=2617518 RepID=UPI0036D081F8